MRKTGRNKVGLSIWDTAKDLESDTKGDKDLQREYKIEKGERD